MSLFKISRLSSSPQSLLLCGENPPLATEVISQLSQYPFLQVENSLLKSEKISRPENLSGIIFFIGFSPPSLSQSVLATQTLLDCLRLANDFNCKLLLVLGSSSPNLVKTSGLISRQFTQVYKTSVDQIEISVTDSDPDLAEGILKKLVFHHHRQPPSKMTASQSKSSLPSPAHRNMSRFPSLLKKLLFILSVGLIYLLIVNALSGILISYSLKNFQNFNFSAFQNGYSGYRFLSRINPLSSLRIFNLGFSGATLSEINQLNSSLQNISLLNSDPVLLSDIIEQSGDILGSVTSSSSFGFLARDLSLKLEQISSSAHKLQTLGSQINLSKSSARVLFTLHDPQSVSPYGGIISGVVLADFASGQINNLVFYSAAKLEALSPGRLRSSAEFSRVSQRETMKFSELAFSPNPDIVGSDLISFVQKALSLQIDYWIPVPFLAFDQLFCQSSDTQAFCQNSFLFDSRSTAPIGESLNLIPPALTFGRQNRLLLNFLNLLDQKKSLIYTQNSVNSTLSALGWAGLTVDQNCNSWLPCQSQFIQLAFSSPSATSGIPEISYQVSSVVSPEQSTLNTRYELTLSQPVSVQPPLVFWVVSPVGINLSSLSVGEKSLPPVSLTDSSGSELKYWYYILDSTADLSHPLVFTSQQPLVMSDRFRLRFNLIFPWSQSGNADISFSYPPTWTTLVYQPPSVASAGHLRYNTGLTSKTIDLDFIKK